MPPYRPEEDRFLAMVAKGNEGECWLWLGATKHGYGVFSRYQARSPVQAYRWAFERYVGAIPPDHELHHTCRTRSCVNPLHLKPLTHREHCIIDLTRDVCPKGHEKDGVDSRGYRRCLTCHREQMRESRTRAA